MSLMRGRSGQGVLEMLLILVVFLGIGVAVSAGLRNMQIVAKLIDGPWEIMQGMITNGVWGTPEKTKPLHPNYIRRHISFEAEDIR